MSFFDRFRFGGERREKSKQEEISQVVSKLIFRLGSLPDSFHPNELIQLMQRINATQVDSLRSSLQGVSVNEEFVKPNAEKDRLLAAVEKYCSQHYPYSDAMDSPTESSLWQRLSSALFGVAEKLSGQQIPSKPEVSLPPRPQPDSIVSGNALNTPFRQAESKSAPHLELPPDSNYEKESTPPLHFEQVRYGKRVQYKDGPLAPGAVYQITQQSRNFPRDIVGRCHPADIGLGLDPVIGWDRYPWKEQDGGIVHTIVESSDGKKYHVCGRLSERSEGGRTLPGRSYIEAHYLAIPDVEWSISAIPYLINVLNCEPKIENTPDIVEPIEIKSDAVFDQPLPVGWLDSVEDLVVRIVGGVTTQTQNWDETIGDFLNKIFYVAVALPKEKAKELTFGSGVWRAADDFKLVNTARAASPTGSRKIGGEWKDTNVVQLEKGKKYIAQLRGLIQKENCQTFRDVINAIEKAGLDY